MGIISVMTDLASFGSAGLMGAMWLWERRLSRHREEEITAAHDRIMRDEQRLAKFTEVVEHNTAAVCRFMETQRETCETLQHVLEEIHHANKS